MEGEVAGLTAWVKCEPGMLQSPMVGRLATFAWPPQHADASTDQLVALPMRRCAGRGRRRRTAIPRRRTLVQYSHIVGDLAASRRAEIGVLPHQVGAVAAGRQEHRVEVRKGGRSAPRCRRTRESSPVSQRPLPADGTHVADLPAMREGRGRPHCKWRAHQPLLGRRRPRQASIRISAPARPDRIRTSVVVVARDR